MVTVPLLSLSFVRPLKANLLCLPPRACVCVCVGEKKRKFHLEELVEVSGRSSGGAAQRKEKQCRNVCALIEKKWNGR
jgi:hypothetical protein